MPVRASAASLCLVVLLGCRGSTEDWIACTDEYVYAINLRVLDERSGEPVSGVTGRVRGGGFVDSLQVPHDDGFATAAGERPGTYHVEVRAPGYQAWDSGGIVAASDECHVVPQWIDVMLRPVQR
jgi:hypothetical protein